MCCLDVVLKMLNDCSSAVYFASIFNSNINNNTVFNLRTQLEI